MHGDLRGLFSRTEMVSQTSLPQRAKSKLSRLSNFTLSSGRRQHLADLAHEVAQVEGL